MSQAKQAKTIITNHEAEAVLFAQQVQDRIDEKIQEIRALTEQAAGLEGEIGQLKAELQGPKDENKKQVLT